MLRITQQSHAAGAKSYFSQPDYYIDGQELQGIWGGRGATALGLAGGVTKEAFHALCDNQRPDGTGTLTARTRTERTVGYDFTFNAPKSVSLVQALTGDETIIKAFEAAVQETMHEAEVEMQTRVRRGGKEENRTTGNMLWARFTHLTGRPVNGVPDPHLHSHVFVFNATHDHEEERWKAGQFRGVKRDARYYEAAFHSRLAGKLQAEGYAIERTKTGWEIAGIDPALLKRFSRRTQVIEELAREQGIVDPEAKDQLGAKTRERKARDLTMPELRTDWDSRLTDSEREALDRVASKTVTVQAPLPEPDAAMNWAIDHAFTRQAVVPVKTLLSFALRQGIGSVSVKQAWKELKGHGIIRRKDGEVWYATTQAILDEEKEMVRFAKSGRGTCRPLGVPGAPLERDWLSADQRRAVRHLLDSFDRVMMVRGAAGTGKTTMMQEAIAGMNAGGHEVIVLAPSIDASRGVLRRAGFEEADTVAQFLVNPDFQAKAEKQVIWVDEAGLLSSRQMHDLFRIAKEHGARLILSGDPKQHASVERGDVLRLLEKQAGLKVARLADIKRQKGRYKEAVAYLSDGRADAGLAILDELGWIQELSDEERYQRLAQDYSEAVAANKTVLAVAPTHAEADAVTATIRQSLRERGELRGEEQTFDIWKPAHLTQAEQRDPLAYEPGEMIQFHKRAPGVRSGTRLVVDGQTPLPLEHADAFQVYRPATLRLAAGDTVRITGKGTTKDQQHKLTPGSTYQVAGFNPRGDIRLTNGWVIGKEFGHLTHGYVVTSWASQGSTVQQVFVAQSSVSFPASSPEQFYVSASRAQEKMTLYTDNREALLGAITQSQSRTTAHELMQRSRSGWWERRVEQYRRLRNSLAWPRPTVNSPRKEREMTYG